MRSSVLTEEKLAASLPAKVVSAALDHAARLVPGKTTIPILSNVMIDARRKADGTGELLVISTNLDQSVTLRVPAEVTAPGSVTVPAKILADTMKKAPDNATATFKAKDGELHLSYGRSRFRLATLPAVDFPTFGTPLEPVPQVGEGKAVFTLEAATLCDMLDAVDAAISKEVTRFYLCGVYLHRHGDQLRAVATNGHVLALREVPAPEGSEALAGGILPPDLSRIVCSLWAKSKDVLKISIDKSRILIEGEAVAVCSKLIDGTYPDYERVVPRGGTSALAMPAAPLASAIERIVTVDTGKTRSIKMSMDGGEISLAARHEGSVASETLDGATASEIVDGYAIGFSARYALDALRSLPGEAVEIQMSTPGDPMLWRNPAEAGALWVVMPLRV
ncbi:DNA polymerase III subunit beta [Xanthobacter sp.]|uniref:DNA polymerase III subunit beta n=1 Tax=Xanthobacter sp. TaxID=35809 RepID=UPI0025E2C5D6|nr:DNA polymerase III subunit beta [Xanthobacter sp.]